MNILKIMNDYETYSYPRIEQITEWNSGVNLDIRWNANCVSEFEDDKITNFYLNVSYSRKSRWDLWNNIIESFLKNDIKTNLDIGCANNHFSFLCNKKNILSYGIDPRENCVKSSKQIFEKNFSNNYGYVGNIKTFNDYFNNYNEHMFDCVSILNFLHGNGHDPAEIKCLFEILPKIAKYAIISEPPWAKLGLYKVTNNYLVIDTIKSNCCVHILYKL
jgi:hypothetical protein